MPWMCRNEEELKQRFKNLDSLYSHIKKNGFSDNPEEMLDVYSYKKKLLRDANRTQGFLDYIMVDISRNGKPLFADGKHRLSIAKILNIDRVPVIVRVRHKYWAKFKNELREYSKIEVGGKLYQKAYHFDLEDIPYIYDESRIKLVKNSTSLTKGTVLDIGAYFGLHSHELERLGFECWAVESNLPRIYFMEKLREANRDSFKIIKKSIFDFKKKGEIKFDMVIAIYIFHHFLKTKSDYEKLKDFLQRLNCREMFLGTHNPKEFETKEVYTNYGPEEFSDFVLANSCLEKKELIKEYKNGRRLYKLYK